jgi:hypothetical protein
MDYESPEAKALADAAAALLSAQFGAPIFGLGSPDAAAIVAQIVEATVIEFAARFEGRLAALESRADAEDTAAFERRDRE